jgi:hypothetical protein
MSNVFGYFVLDNAYNNDTAVTRWLVSLASIQLSGDYVAVVTYST